MSSDAPVLNKFSPNTGIISGYAGLAVAAFVLGSIALQMRTLQGLQVALGVLLATGFLWVTIIRPRAHVTRSTLVLRNMLSDTFIPLASVETVTMRQALNVWADGKRHLCLGIGKTRRQLTGRQRRAGLPFTRPFPEPNPPSSRMRAQETRYEDFVVERIRELAKDAQRDGLPGGPATRVVAWPEVVALLVLAVAFGISLLL